MASTHLRLLAACALSVLAVACSKPAATPKSAPEDGKAPAPAAADAGDRDRTLELLTDLPAELRLLDFIRTAAGHLAPDLPAGLAPFLWREYLIPWTKQSEVAHLLAP